MDEYKKIVQTISPLVGEAGVSIEVFSDENTSAPEMFSQGQEMFSWITNAYINPGALNIPSEGIKELAPQLLPNKDDEIVTRCANTH